MGESSEEELYVKSSLSSAPRHWGKGYRMQENLDEVMRVGGMPRKMSIRPLASGVLPTS